MASLLHAHLIGELTVHAGGDLEAWRSFLLLLSRPPDEVRAEGGIARLWATTAGRHVELREIDYAEVLRERARRPAGGLGGRDRELPAGRRVRARRGGDARACSASRATPRSWPS